MGPARCPRSRSRRRSARHPPLHLGGRRVARDARALPVGPEPREPLRQHDDGAPHDDLADSPQRFVVRQRGSEIEAEGDLLHDPERPPRAELGPDAPCQPGELLAQDLVERVGADHRVLDRAHPRVQIRVRRTGDDRLDEVEHGLDRLPAQAGARPRLLGGTQLLKPPVPVESLIHRASHGSAYGGDPAPARAAPPARRTRRGSVPADGPPCPPGTQRSRLGHGRARPLDPARRPRLRRAVAAPKSSRTTGTYGAHAAPRFAFLGEPPRGLAHSSGGFP